MMHLFSQDNARGWKRRISERNNPIFSPAVLPVLLLQKQELRFFWKFWYVAKYLFVSPSCFFTGQSSGKLLAENQQAWLSFGSTFRFREEKGKPKRNKKKEREKLVNENWTRVHFTNTRILRMLSVPVKRKFYSSCEEIVRHISRNSLFTLETIVGHLHL